METIGGAGLEPVDPLGGGHVTASTSEVALRRTWLAQQSWASRSAIVGALVGALVLAVLFDKVRTTIVTVVVAVSACAAIWIGANLLFDQARGRFRRFNTLRFGAVGALLGIVLHGNGLTLGSEGGTISWVVGPLIGGVAFGAIGFLSAATDDPQRRRIISIAGFGLIGVAIGLLLREEYYPGVDWLTTLIYTVVVALSGAGLSAAAKQPPQNGALIGAGIGWVLGYWGGADVGDGSIGTAILGAAVPGVLLGLRLSGTTNPDLTERTAIDRRSRPWIFLGPALLFIAVMLVIPAIRTAILSLYNDNSEEFVGLENYGATFTDKASWDSSDWTNIFTSAPFFIGVVLLIIAVIVGARSKRLTGHAVELGNPTVAPLVVGALFVCFAAFTVMRGTIINNLWWVVTVTFFSTAIGLAVAVLADQRGGERVAKSIIFMPMALSLVGASIIWRFMYQTREVSKQQTGVLNAVWVGLGRLQHRFGPADTHRRDPARRAAGDHRHIPGQVAHPPSVRPGRGAGRAPDLRRLDLLALHPDRRRRHRRIHVMPTERSSPKRSSSCRRARTTTSG